MRSYWPRFGGAFFMPCEGDRYTNGRAADAAESRTRDDIRLHMRTPPMGMSGVQVLGTGGSLGGVAEGRHNSIRCIRHSKRGRPPAAPLTPRQPPPATYSQSLFGDSGQLGAIIGSSRYAADAASGEGAVSKELGCLEGVGQAGKGRIAWRVKTPSDPATRRGRTETNWSLLPWPSVQPLPSGVHRRCFEFAMARVAARSTSARSPPTMTPVSRWVPPR